jgi:protein-S-isoprenylcysteine O-methyltransferase Ste14
MIIEGRLRQGEAAQSMQVGEDDMGTTAAVGATFGVALAGGPVAALSARGRLPARFGWVGVGLMATGLALRVAAARTLGASYTRTLRTQAGQPVVQVGPYRFVRHPGYAGVLAMWLGYGVALTSAPAILVTTGPNLVAYLRRIDAEERMLADSLGDVYRSYQRQSARLLPGVY